MSIYPSFHVIIPASGSGSRAQTQTPKQFMTINGKMILQHTIDIFAAHPACQSITIAINADDKDIYGPKLTFNVPHAITTGGKERQNSIYKCLKNIPNVKDDDLVLIHDAARPYLHKDDLNIVLQTYKDKKSSITLAKNINDTLVKKDYQRVDRAELFALQTPQAFTYKTILLGQEQASPETLHTDDTSLVTALGEDITTVIAKHYNEKITFNSDIEMAKKMLNPIQYEYRTGQGYDVHAFASEEDNRPLILCGVNIKHDKGLAGHSDADVGLHTITDAILGAIAQGDIGRHFPPSNPDFKNMDSAVFLEKARDLVAQCGSIITNIDLTFMCETPKITPHAPEMIQRVASILQIEDRRVSIKATTTEKLGFTGRKEGIAAQAVATIKVPE